MANEYVFKIRYSDDGDTFSEWSDRSAPTKTFQSMSLTLPFDIHTGFSRHKKQSFINNARRALRLKFTHSFVWVVSRLDFREVDSDNLTNNAIR